MNEDEGRQEGLPPLTETGEEMTDEQRARQAQSPDPGRPAGDVSPGADAPSAAAGTQPIGDEGQRKGQTTHPAPPDDVGTPPHEELPHPAEGDKT